MNAPVEFKLPEKVAGYRTFTLGEFTFQRDEYFVTITWPAKGQRQSHTMSADAFLRAIMRDVAFSVTPDRRSIIAVPYSAEDTDVGLLRLTRADGR